MIAIATGACTSSGPLPGGGTARAGSEVTFMLLGDGTIHANEAPPANGFYVLGRVEAGAFVPTSIVLGTGVMGDEGQPGWLELRDGSFHADQTGRAPIPPYVHGFKGEDGVFRPDTHKVIHTQ